MRKKFSVNCKKVSHINPGTRHAPQALNSLVTTVIGSTIAVSDQVLITQTWLATWLDSPTHNLQAFAFTQ